MSHFNFEAVFLPAVGGLLPDGLRALIVNKDGEPDSTLLATRFSMYEKEVWTEANYASADEDNFSYEETDEKLTIHAMAYYHWFERYAFANWLQAVSEVFPDVKIAFRGQSDDFEPYSLHFIAQGGRFAEVNADYKPGIDYFNHIALISPWRGFNCLFSEDYLDRRQWESGGKCNARVRRLLRNKSANTTLLWLLERELDLTPKQEELRRAHPNYVEGFVPDKDWWMTVSP